jgi:NADH-quinone oxidoreductase subunit N
MTSLLLTVAAGDREGVAQAAGELDMVALVPDVIPEIILAMGGIVVLVYALAAPRRRQTDAALIALAAVLAAAVATAVTIGDREFLTFADSYARDDAAAWARLIVLAATGLVIGLSLPWFRDDARHGEYYTLLLFSALGAVLLAGTTDLKQLVIATLLSSTTGAVLIAYHRGSRVASEAAMKYYLLAALTNTASLVGVAYLFGIAGSTTLPELTDMPSGSEFGIAVGLALILLSLTFKLGASPAHAWVPDVAEGAPAPVAAFVTSVPKIGALVFLARLAMSLPADVDSWRPAIALIAAVTMTLGNLAALWQDDLRRLLGWSAVSQTGYGLLAIVALGASDLAIPSILFFLLSYALANIAAFGVVVELRGRTDLAAYAGLARRRPWLSGMLAISFLSFIGIPPLAGFFAKLALFGAVIEAGYGWLAILGAINTVISILYYARVLAPMYFGDRPPPLPVLARSSAIVTLIAGAAVVVAGLASEFFFRAFEAASLLPS